jgi:beta-lactam-binding protein with PASTA domain
MQLRRGWQLRVAESLGPQRVQIPNVIGESERAAEINIKRRGLDMGNAAVVSLPDATADQVIAQSPPPNASGISTPKISLLTGQPALPDSYVMPSFVGQPLGIATNALKDAGFLLGKATLQEQPPPAPVSNEGTPVTAPAPAPQQPPATPSPDSIIVSQSPPAGWKVTVGSTINFVVK